MAEIRCSVNLVYVVDNKCNNQAQAYQDRTDNFEIKQNNLILNLTLENR